MDKGTTLTSIRAFKPGEKRRNSDGSYSTEVTRTVKMPSGGWANVPSLYMGPNGPKEIPARISDDALANFAAMLERRTGEVRARHTTVEGALKAAKKRSASGGVR